MHPAALRGSRHHLAYRSLQALVSVRDHALDPAQSAPCVAAQKVRPERFGFGGADLHAQPFAPAIGVGARRSTGKASRPRSGAARTSAPARRSRRTGARPGSWKCRPCPWPGPGRPPNGSRCPARRLPAPRRPMPSRRCGAVPGRAESSCRIAASGCAAPHCRHASPAATDTASALNATSDLPKSITACHYARVTPVSG